MIKIITEEQDSFLNLLETEPKYKDLWFLYDSEL